MTRKLLATLLIFVFLVSTASAATLTVPTKYKTIQKAVDAAKEGDTIYVNAGTYKEIVTVNDKRLSFQGQKVGSTYKYPKVYGFKVSWADDQFGSIDSINGFAITKYGIEIKDCGATTIRNNYFYNCGIRLLGHTVCDNIVINNKFTGNYDYTGVAMCESYDNSIIGNTFTKANDGIATSYGSTCKTITKNTFSGCKIGFHCDYVPTCLIGNSYKGNKINIKVDDAFSY